MRERICIACGSRLPEKALMDFEGMPASAQNIPNREEVKADEGMELHLCQCGRCGLVQFDCQPVDYYRDVIRSGGFSTTMVELRRSQYRHFIETYGLEGKKIIEAGCGQGEFLSVLKEFPVKGYGIEHKEDLVELARSRGLTVWRQFADQEGTILKNPDGEGEGPYDAFLSFNFLEHQPDPVGMLKCLYRNLTEDGLGLLTVPSFEYILEHDGYYELIRDHLAYYTFDTLRFVLGRAGFEVLEEEMVNRDTLSVIVKKVKSSWGERLEEMGETEECRAAAESQASAEGKPKVAAAERSQDAVAESQATAEGKTKVAAAKRSQEAAAEKWAAADISGLVKSRTVIGNEIAALFERLEREGKTLAVWGASHQGFTLAATTSLGEKAQYIIDSAPFKQGLFAPASHLPIVAPAYYQEQPVDAVLIVAPGYTDEIAGNIREKFGSGVEILAIKSNHLEHL